MENSKTMLAQPIQVGRRIANNRFVINAMECCDATEDGSFSESAFERYQKLIEGNAGIIFFESFTLQWDSRARKNQLGMMPQNLKILENAIRRLKEVNDKPILIFQLNHSGEVSGGEFSKPVCVKPLYGKSGEVVSEEYVDKTIQDFINASKILYDIGADGVDLKFCHGYFGSQVLRPYNDRKWKYGGSWENRSRFAFDMVEGVRKLVPDKNFLVGSKISIWEGFPGGQGTAGPDTPVMDLTESIALCKGLEERGVSFIMQSSGAAKTTKSLQIPSKHKPDDAYLNFYFAKVVKNSVKPETVVIGSAYTAITNGNNILRSVTPEQNNLLHWGNYNIAHGYTDMIALGRQSFADPYLPLKYLEGREDEISWCKVCDCCYELLTRQQEVGCVIYNKKYAEIFKKQREQFGKFDLVIS